MEIEFTINVKEKHNPPVFNKELGKGVVAKVTIDFKGATEKNYEHPRFLQAVYDEARELLDDYFEVTFDTTKFNIK